MADADETVEATLERANRLFTGGLGGTLGILKEADADLSKRLHGLVKKKGTKDLRFTEAQALIYRQQIQLTQKYLEQRLLGHTHAQAIKAVEAGTKTTTKLLSTLEKRFTGIARPLQLESQAMQDTIVRGLSSSLLRQHQSSVARYGNAMIQDFERVMRVGAVQGMTQHEVISKLVAQGELGGINAASLNKAEPGYFPQPSGYVTRRYWAERIVRTETAYAYNAANNATISAARVSDFPDMQKKILAHFDQRTAQDSIYVHGQIRPVNGLFTDGAGRQYQHPPARPNDREVVIPWRPVWHELPATAPAPPEEQAKAKIEAAPGLAPASTGQILVQASSRAKIAALAKKLKAEAGALALEQDTASTFHAAQKAAAASLLEGTQQVGAAKLVDAQALAKAQALQHAKQTKGGIDPEVVKAKAEQYKAELQAKAAQKVAEAQAARAAALKVAAHKHIMLLAEESGEMLDNPGPDLVKHLKKQAKENPALFAEMQKQVGAKTPLAMAKKIAPEHDYSSFTKKKPEPVPLPEPPKPPLPELEFKEVSGYIDIHDKATGAKLAYMKPAPGGGVSVTPPATLTGFAPKTFATKEEGAPYAIEVSKILQAQKAEQQAAEAKLAAEKKAAAEKLAAMSKAEKAKLMAETLGAPVKMHWAEAWQPPKRAEIAMTNRAAAIDKALEVGKRSGTSVAADGGWVEDFQVGFKTEIVDGKRQTVVRFRVNEQHAPEVRANLTKLGVKDESFPGFAKLKDLKSSELDMTTSGSVLQRIPGIARVQRADVGGASVRYFVAESGGDHPAMKNVVEMRFDEPKGKGARWAKFEELAKQLGIDTSEPSHTDLQTYKQVKVMSVTDRVAALQLGQLKERTPEAIGKIWAEAVKRDPRAQELLDDAKLREVAPGHFALYSDKLAERYRSLGVTHLTHNLAGSDDVIVQLLSSEDAGLLSSRERFNRGLIFRGMSTETDFGTGGADSVFTRLGFGPGKQHTSGWVEIDHSELGRFDTYAFNSDTYGRAGKDESASRMRLDGFESLRLDGRQPGSGNETMLRHSVPRAVIRRVVVDAAAKKRITEELKQRGVKQINGVPVDEVVQS